MILKSYEIDKKFEKNIYLFHGQNDGHKEQIVDGLIKSKYETNTYKYFEREILDNLDNFYNSILSKSFFEDEKLFIIKDATDKIKNEIEILLEKEISGTKIILFSKILDKKSKLRNLFEKNANLISVAFYADNNQTLVTIANNFFKKKKISISFETINVIVNKANGERKNLINELEKIEMYLLNKDKISINEIEKITNNNENSDLGELVDNCLAKNEKRIIYIMNENNFGPEDTISIIRIFLFKAKRLLNLVKNYTLEKNVENTISNYRPPIFWKDKEIVKKQITAWSSQQVENLILEINEIELLIKKNSQASIQILSDFIINKSQISNNEL